MPGLRPATAKDVPAITRLLNAFLGKFAFAPSLAEDEVAHWLLPRPGVVDSFVVDTATAAAALAAADALLLGDNDAAPAGAGGPRGKASAAAAAAAAAKAPPAPAVHPVSGTTVTDFLSFYHLPSTIIGHDKHKMLRAAYCFYMAPGAEVPLPPPAGPAAPAAADAESGCNGAAAAPSASCASAVAHPLSLSPVGHTVAQVLEDALVLARDRDVDVFNALDLMQNAPALLKELKFGPGDGHLQYYMYNWACPPVEPKDVGLVLL